MTLASSTLLFCWELTKRHPGLIMVLLGVVGEVICDWKEMGGRLARAKKFSAILLIVGLAIEFIEAAKSDRDVSSAIERAGIAKRDAAQANERAALTESNNLVLRSSVVALELKLKPRIITADQVEKFIFLTEKIPKIPIKICVGFNCQLSYAGQVRSMFSSAKFATDSSVNASGGLTADLSKAVVRPAGESFEWPAVIFVKYGTNKTTGEVKLPYSSENVKGFNRPVTLNTNDLDEVFSDLEAVFQQIDISFSIEEDAEWVKPGEMAILVPPKNE